MDDHTTFREHLFNDPNDTHARRVYADRLQDDGNDAHAARMRWWADALDYIRSPGGHSEPNATNNSIARVERALPAWVARLNQVETARRMLRGTPAAEHTRVREALHAAELDGYGLLEPHERSEASLRVFNTRRSHLDGAGDVHQLLSLMHRVLDSDPHSTFTHPVDHSAAMLLADHASATRPGSFNPTYRKAGQDALYQAHRLRDFARTNPPPGDEPGPVKLARPLGWIKDRIAGLFGGRDPVRQPGDGIVHTRDNPTAVYAEHNAVAQAIRLLGGADHTKQAHQYMNWVAGFVKAKPDHDAVKAYVEAAKMAGGTAGPELTAAVKPLVGAVNLLMAAHGKAQRFVKPVSEATPTLPPPAYASSAPVEPTVPDAPIDLSDVPDAPAEDRHTAIMRMTRAGEGKDAIVQHLIEAHGAPHRKAALASIRAAYNRAIVLHQRAKGEKPTKLAAYTGGPITPDHLTGRTAARDPYTGDGFGFHPRVEGTALAYHLRQVQRDHPHLSQMVDHALTGRRYGSSAGQDDPFVAVGKALKKLKHPLADAHDWGALTDQHAHDRKIEQFVRLHVLDGGGSQLEYWDRVRRGLATGRAKNADQFWARFERAGLGLTREQAVEAMHRIGERELDRAYLSTIREEGLKQNPDWRQVMGAHK